jgi:hypothetical protein
MTGAVVDVEQITQFKISRINTTVVPYAIQTVSVLASIAITLDSF